jgi:hypothetical protein
MRTYPVLLAMAAGASLLIAGAGCEVESADSADQAEIQVSPSSVTLHQGQSAEFTATGWQNYRWSLSIPDIGTLSHQTGDKTVYTAIVVTGTNTVQTLTCYSTVSGSNGTSTVSGTALIVLE